MKTIMISMVASALLFTFGCDYDYGKYGKEKTESNSEQTPAEEASPKQFNRIILGYFFDFALKCLIA